MDRISKSLLEEFTHEFELHELEEDAQFEHFSAYITIKRQYSGTLDTFDVVIGAGADTGIDAIAVIVNGVLVSDIDALSQITDDASTLDVSFIFMQAKRSAKFEAAQLGSFGFGVVDFFSSNPKLSRNDDIKSYAEIMEAIYDKSSKFKKSRPSCHLYYVTTGAWKQEKDLEARRLATIADLEAAGLFSSVDFQAIGADELAKLYNSTKNAISRTVQFSNRVELPEIQGVKEAFLGYLPVSEFVKLLTDDSGELARQVFYDNVRDWQEYNRVNDEMRETLITPRARRFVLMNNGITIIAKDLQRVSAKFTIEDFQIVNGCQTSHVLFDQQDNIDQETSVPVRLIVTQDEAVIEDIIRATNRQTQLKDEQFLALSEFARKLELFLSSQSDQDEKLYYERRSNQYARTTIEKTRVITPPNLIRAYAAVFRKEPHRTTRNFKGLLDLVGKEIMVETDKLEPYYAAAFAYYRVEYLFRTNRLHSAYKPARFHLLMAAGLLTTPLDAPANSNAIVKQSNKFCQMLWDARKSEEVFASAAKLVDKVAAGNLHRDNVRTQSFTEALIHACGN